MTQKLSGLYGLILCIVLAYGAFAQMNPDQIWDKEGSYVIPWGTMTVKSKTFALEKYRDEINYGLINLGKSFKVIDPVEINSRDYEREVGYITYGLISDHYCRYGDYLKCVEYEYKDYLQQRKCEMQALKAGGLAKGDCWWGTVHSAPLLEVIINTLEINNDYKRALFYYQKDWEDWVNRYDGRTIEEKLASLKNQAQNDSDIGRLYDNFMSRWNKAKQLAKTSKPMAKEVVVQNHEWFYSEKQEDVLCALKYYYKNHIDFMLEKALKHKDTVVALKAEEYLKNLKKGVPNEIENKKP